MSKTTELIDTLASKRCLSTDEYEFILTNYSANDAEYAAKIATDIKKSVYGNDVFLRGLIEISSICKNNCLYCGLRKSNIQCERYRLSKDDILSCCDVGYPLGFRTFVLQGGEDPFFNDDVLIDIITSIKSKYPDCAVTLSLGERSFESYALLKKAGADRYLLRHESAHSSHYSKLHPSTMSYDNRMQCLYNLKKLGFQTGCGFMVGSPFQTLKNIALDLKFIEEFKPEMCGIGPFIPHHATPFAKYPAGSVKLCCFLLSLIRIMQPNVLLPATTALGTLSSDGREMGLLAGANVIMPNLSPSNVRKKYELYDGKAYTGTEAGENKKIIEDKIKAIGFNPVVARGDIKINNTEV